nr:hypothetical protein [Desulfobacula sp.]
QDEAVGQMKTLQKTFQDLSLALDQQKNILEKKTRGLYPVFFPGHPGGKKRG